MRAVASQRFLTAGVVILSEPWRPRRKESPESSGVRGEYIRPVSLAHPFSGVGDLRDATHMSTEKASSRAAALE